MSGEAPLTFEEFMHRRGFSNRPLPGDIWDGGRHSRDAEVALITTEVNDLREAIQEMLDEWDREPDTFNRPAFEERLDVLRELLPNGCPEPTT